MQNAERFRKRDTAMVGCHVCYMLCHDTRLNMLEVMLDHQGYTHSVLVSKTECKHNLCLLTTIGQHQQTNICVHCNTQPETPLPKQVFTVPIY